MTGRPCYMNGVNIRTARGEVTVESIQPGDSVVVMRDGKEILEPVKWVGHATVDLTRHAHVEDAAPIRFRAGAIGENQPARDLLVSPEHCLILDGRCVPAKLLVNGGSIVSERDHPPFSYHHIELDRHGILLAENALAESYLDTGNRSLFDNGDEPRQLHPEFRLNGNAERWQTDACAPLANAAEVEVIWTRLAARSVQIGFPIPTVTTAVDADVHLVADGVVIEAVSNHDSRYVFMVPAGVTSVSLRSRFCIPSDKMQANQRDTRRLGVRVDWIAIRSGDAATILSADHPALQDRWNDVERHNKSMWRWTDGMATVPWENITGPAVLTVCCTPMDQYPLYDDKLRVAA